MAPTEILAEQHRPNFEQWFTDMDISVAWLTGKVKKRQGTGKTIGEYC